MVNLMNLRKIDISLVIITILLVIFGLLMVYSASNVVALYKYNDSFYFIKRQALFACIGIILMFIFMKINIEKIYKLSIYIFITSVILLLLVLIPGIGVVRGGACRCYTLK